MLNSLALSCRSVVGAECGYLSSPSGPHVVAPVRAESLDLVKRHLGRRARATSRAHRENPSRRGAFYIGATLLELAAARTGRPALDLRARHSFDEEKETSVARASNGRTGA